jgi:hypothetical protein
MQINDAKTEDLKKSEWECVHEIENDVKKTQPTNECISVCDIWKYNLHRLVTKAEQRAPIHVQAYNQAYTEFLRCADDLFDIFFDWQKQYFDKILVDKKTINAYGASYESGTDNIAEFMDAYTEYKKLESDLFGNAMKIGSNYLCGWADMCSKMTSFWNLQLNR